MPNYEVLYILNPSVAEEERKALVAKFKEYVESNKGTVKGIDEWGLKKLAYPIKYKSEGYYVLYQFEATAEAVKNLVSLMRIDENVLRQMCLRKDK